ncbi:MAG TPA: MFS transporter [Streptosporangiaceae bacterium]|nr:MFS transporter [Streptosporangiaceae bacterium]
MDDLPGHNGRGLRGNRYFHITFWAQACTDYCDSFLAVTLTWGALHELGGTALGLILACWTIPRGAMLLMSGVFVDRWDRRTIAVGVSAALGGLALGAAAVSRLHELAAWAGVAVVIGILDAFRLPVGASILPMVVAEEHLVSANRWASLREWSSATVGPAIGGVLVAAAGVAGAFTVAAGLYGVSCLLMIFAPRMKARADDEEKTRVLADLKGGFRLVATHPRLRVLLPTFAMTNLFILGLIGVAIPVFVKDVLHAGPSGLGFLSGSFAAGVMAGTFVSPRLPARWQESQICLFALFALSDVLLALVGAAPVLPVACVLYFLSGLTGGPPATYYRTMLQTLPPKEFLGRVNALARATSFGLEPVSTTAVGALSARISASVLLLAGGGCATCIDLFGVLSSRRAIRRGPASAAPAQVPREVAQ